MQVVLAEIGVGASGVGSIPAEQLSSFLPRIHEELRKTCWNNLRARG